MFQHIYTQIKRIYEIQKAFLVSHQVYTEKDFDLKFGKFDEGLLIGKNIDTYMKVSKKIKQQIYDLYWDYREKKSLMIDRQL